MKIRWTGRPDEAPRALEQLAAAFDIDRGPRRNPNGRPAGGLERVYLDVQFPDSEITTVVAAHVLWHFGEPGREPGGFTRDLIALIDRADTANRARLALGYPAYVLAVSLAGSPGGVDTLKAIAAGEAGVTAGVS